ncbi:energy transducer TonB [Bacteroides sp. OttesenSCG-928-D19]|nr:energy transducer TonB [Bacteroides sp. OttesenSCG-928-D19]
MEIKKSKKAELESQRGTRFAMGIIVVLAFMFITFEWTEYDKKFDVTLMANDPIFELTLAPVTFPEKPPLPPPPAPKPVDVLTIVDDIADVPDARLDTSEETGGAVDIGRYIAPEIEEDKVEETEIFTHAEYMPEFPGGTGALFAYLSKNMKYPVISQENNVQGKVIVQFVVDKDGSISNVVVARGVDPYLDKEAIRVIQSMPKWKPGMQRNTPVRVRYTVPVTFRLQ